MVPVIICSSICQGTFLSLLSCFSQFFHSCLLFIFYYLFFSAFLSLFSLWEQIISCFFLVYFQFPLNSFRIYFVINIFFLLSSLANELNLVHTFSYFFFFKPYSFLLLVIVIAVNQIKHRSLFSSQGVDNTGDVYRATYTAFRCSKVSGTLGAYEKLQVGIYVQLDCYCFYITSKKKKIDKLRNTLFLVPSSVSCIRWRCSPLFDRLIYFRYL